MPLPLFLLLGAGGCLGTLSRNAIAEAVALAPRDVLALPVRDNREYWLLRSERGWRGAHEIRYGSNEKDSAVATVRVVLFDDVTAATAAYERLTPAYVYLLLRDRMRGPPVPFEYPAPLPGDATATSLFSVLLPPSVASFAEIMGQITAVRSGRAVLLIESIGIDPERLVPAIEALCRAATSLSP